jgi:hypothetical protein
MKVIVAGSRTICDYHIVNTAIWASGFKITEVVSGGARGVDTLGERWAKLNRIPVRRFLAEWEKFGRSAGPRRNEQMAYYGDALILIWDGKSAGSRNMLNIARARRLKIAAFVLQSDRRLKRLKFDV